jgi:hypothetical protein
VADEVITNQIQITGIDQAKKDLTDLGTTGEQQLNKLAGAGDGLAGIGDTAKASFGKIGAASQDIGAATAAFGDLNVGIKATRASLAQFLPNTQQASTLLQKMSAAFTGIIAGFKGTSTEAGNTAAAMGNANNSARSLGTTLRLLGRATGERELGQLGRTVAILGRAFEVALPAVIGFGLEKIASSATTAASNFADLAAELRVTAQQFSALSSLTSGTGISADKLGSSLKAVSTLTKQTAESDAAFAKQQAATKDQLRQTSDSIRDQQVDLKNLTQAGVDLNQQMLIDQNTALTALNQASERGASQDKINELSTALGQALIKDQKAIKAHNEEVFRANRALNDLFDAQAKVEREAQLASVELIQNGTALQKLGIGALDANGKLKKAPEVLLQIADALKQMGAGSDRTNVEFDLVAAGVDRKLLPALRQGSVAFQQLQKDSENINPGFTDKQIETADNFAIATSKVADAFANLANQLGLAVAPEFTNFLTTLQELITKITPGVVEFGQALASIVLPILTGIGQIISNVIVPAFQGLFTALDGFAKLINQVFGTNVTGMQIFVAILGAIFVAFTGMTTAVILAVSAVGLLIKALGDAGVNFESVKQFATDTWNTIVQLGTDAATGVTNAWNDVLTFFTDLWTQLAALPGQAWTAIVKLGTDAADAITARWQLWRDTLIQFWTDLQDTVLGVWNKIKDIWAKVTGQSTNTADTASTNATGGGGFAMGGHITGRGTATSDSIPIWASHGEFMQPARAVKKYGLQFMEAIRTLRFDPSILGLAMGGGVNFVPAGLPKVKFADGGPIRGGNTLNLTIGTDTFDGLKVEDQTMKRLTRFANAQQLRSTGRKPAWYR